MTTQTTPAQALNECVTRHIVALIDMLKTQGVPNKETLILALEEALRNSWKAGEDAGI